MILPLIGGGDKFGRSKLCSGHGPKVLFSRLPPERTAKRTHEAKGEHVLIGSCCVQGFRATMEDEVIIEASLPSPLQSWSLAAVLDGHGGDLGNDS